MSKNNTPVKPSIGITTGRKKVNVWDRREGKELARDVAITSSSLILLLFKPSAKMEYPTVGLNKHASIEERAREFIFRCFVIGNIFFEIFSRIPELIR